jgi:RNA polymerase sigma factor (sigma-70 family)
MQGDRQIFDEYSVRLRLFVAARSSNRDDVDDIVQETFLRFYAFRGDQEIHQPVGYLYRIALNLIIDRSRRRSPLNFATSIDEVGEDSLATRPRQEDGRRLADLQRAYANALSELSPRCAEVFHLRRHREMATPDVAAHLSITTRMVQKHMVTAMAHLHHCLRSYVSDDAPDDDGVPSVPTICQIASSSHAHARLAGSRKSASNSASEKGVSPAIRATN